ncbi:MAG: RNA methyltransferase [Actinomycetota bacterium]|nr:RNA methyltransferase [Actinomycetota bacterium]
MAAAEITSTSNRRIKRLVGLRDRRERDLESVFLIEGPRDIDRALGAGLQAKEIYYDTARHDACPYPAGLEVGVETAALDRASYRGRSQGVIAVFGQFPVSLESLTLKPDALILMMEAIEKPGNLGAVLRTADACGADAVIAADPGADPFNPNVIRASTGALFTIPVAVTDLEAAVSWLRKRDVIIVAADPVGTTDLWQADLTGSRAILVGSEHDGLSEEARSAADITVSIPMHGAVDSLNTSISAAILAYEALRQRVGTRRT